MSNALTVSVVFSCYHTKLELSRQGGCYQIAWKTNIGKEAEKLSQSTRGTVHAYNSKRENLN